jgi:hypothetical protein
MCSAAKTARHRIVVMLLTQVSQCGKRTVFLVWARVLRKSAGGYGEEEKKNRDSTSSHRLSWTGVATGTCTVQRQTGRYMTSQAQFESRENIHLFGLSPWFDWASPDAADIGMAPTPEHWAAASQ